MTEANPASSRVIKLDKTIGGPRGDYQQSVRAKKISDYPDIPAPYLQVAQYFASPLLLGPPICDELMALVMHTFTEEEATLLQHLKTPTGKTAATVAAAVQRPLDEVYLLLERLTHEKPVLLTFGQGERKRYMLLPLVPGVFESIMVCTSTDALTDWHRRFAALFEELFETGYLMDYASYPVPAVRYVPVGRSVEFQSLALPSDRLEEVLEPYKTFAVGMCQCRMTEQIVGRGCSRTMETCVGFGDIVEPLIQSGRMRRVEKQEVLEIKARAEAEGLVNFTSDLLQSIGGASCSCCGCCCHVLRTVSQFNMPGLIAPPHFRPRVDLEQCSRCGKCARACPMGAIIVKPREKTYQYLPERCIGCGLCAVACDKKHAITMEPTPLYRQPPKSSFTAIWQALPNYLRNAWSVWRKYR